LELVSWSEESYKKQSIYSSLHLDFCGMKCYLGDYYYFLAEVLSMRYNI